MIIRQRDKNSIPGHEKFTRTRDLSRILIDEDLDLQNVGSLFLHMNCFIIETCTFAMVNDNMHSRNWHLESFNRVQ